MAWIAYARKQELAENPDEPRTINQMNTTQLRASGLLAVASAALGTAAPAQSHVHAIDYFPLEIGNQWTLTEYYYRTTGVVNLGGVDYVRRADKHHGGSYNPPIDQVDWVNANADLYTNDEQGLRVHGGGNPTNLELFDNPVHILNAVVRVNDVLTSTVHAPSWADYHTARYEIHSITDTVSVAGQTFTECIKLQETTWKNGTFSDDKYVWLAPGVGKVDMQSFTGNDGGFFWEEERLVQHWPAFPAFTPYCHGDGTATPCPCANQSEAGDGCVHSGGAGGRLAASLQNSLATDTLALIAVDVIPSQPGLFFQANNQINGGSGLTFGDGLRCAGGQLLRLKVSMATSDGTSSFTGIAARAAAKGYPISSGSTLRYQYWYRDPSGSPCGNDFNLTNAIEVYWMP